MTFPLRFWTWFERTHKRPILQGLDGIVHKGELLLVLGRPGSGCTTFLKTITGEMRGLQVDSDSLLHYRGT
jgi:ABC-type multidrug transport system ATPase subunit